jgi:hypothetical protein
LFTAVHSFSPDTVLPKPVRDRLVAELGKRLDVDIEEALTSPKLKLQLSPAELDSSLLELYEVMIESPGGDLLKLIGGGGAIALQNLYLRRQAEKERMRNGWLPDVFPSLVDEREDDGEASPLQRIRWAMRKNIPSTKNYLGSFTASQKSNKLSASKVDKGGPLKMTLSRPSSVSAVTYSTVGMRPHSFSRAPARRGSSFVSILI